MHDSIIKEEANESNHKEKTKTKGREKDSTINSFTDLEKAIGGFPEEQFAQQRHTHR